MRAFLSAIVGACDRFGGISRCPFSCLIRNTLIEVASESLLFHGIHLTGNRGGAECIGNVVHRSQVHRLFLQGLAFLLFRDCSLILFDCHVVHPSLACKELQRENYKFCRCAPISRRECVGGCWPMQEVGGLRDFLTSPPGGLLQHLSGG